MTQKRWLIPADPDLDTARRLAAETNSPQVLWRLLVRRGVRDVETARRYMKPGMDILHDPHLMKGLPELVDRLVAARERGARIGVHGDYDVDGLTSTSLYTLVLRQLGYEVEAFVPHRMVDGYGVSVRALDRFVEQGVSVILTCDTGFSAHAAVQHAVDTLGLEMLVTDHHLAGDELPRAHALVNPNQPGCPYPFKGLCGVGVAYKVLQALVRRLGMDEAEILNPYLDLVAIGTVCDIMPLEDENRAIVYHGVRQLRRTRNVGLRALLDEVGIEPKRVSEQTMGWVIGPRLNAVGRIDDAHAGLAFLLESDPKIAAERARSIDETNTARKTLTRQIEAEAVAMVEAMDLSEVCGLALFAPHTVGPDGVEWHHGVIGIVAGRMVERTGRPCFIFARDEATGLWKGSGRCPASSGANLKVALDALRDEFLVAGGGHAAAAGATLRESTPEAQAAFAHAFDMAMREQVSVADLVPTIRTDGVVGLDEISLEVHDTFFRRLAPFGHANPEITFVSQQVMLRSVRAMGKDRTHARLTLEQNGVVHTAIAWGLLGTHPWLTDVPCPVRADVCYKVQENEFRDERTLQLLIEDIRVHLPADVPATSPTSRTPSNAVTSQELFL